MNDYYCLLALIGILNYVLFGIYFRSQTSDDTFYSSSASINTLNMMIVVQCLLRVISFLVWFYLTLEINPGSIPTTITNDDSNVFVQKSQLIVLNFPDFVYLSLYILMLMVSTEGYLKVRILMIQYL